MVRAKILVLCLLVSVFPEARAAAKDAPFKQDARIRIETSPELKDAIFLKLLIDRDGIVHVLTDQGIARVFGTVLAPDRSFRPFADRKVLDIALHRGSVIYLFDDQLLSNASAGKLLVDLPTGRFNRLIASEEGTLLVAGDQAIGWVKDGKLASVPPPIPSGPKSLFVAGNEFLMLCEGVGYRFVGSTLRSFRRLPNATTLAARGGEWFIGTSDGYFVMNLQPGRETLPLQNRLPATHITCLKLLPDSLWAGTTRGVFRRNRGGAADYYASKRWLASDVVVDLQTDSSGNLLVLNASGLDRIEFRTLTLAEKASHYDRKIRQRHMRFGFCSELRLLNPGDPSSARMIDTDNDGTWSNYYMASQAFRYASTRDETALRNAWETFEALERLESITGIEGFPARTFERAGFKYSDPDRWHPTPDGHWEWKGTTSSDEIIAHTFGCAVMWECAARTAADRARLIRFYDRILSHILRNNLYLVDADGQPTLWGRWHPEYVNAYPASVVDRRLNSAEIIAMLQFGFAITRNPDYRDKAVDLLVNHGYRDNIASSMKLIRRTEGVFHQGIDMGSGWNHSDDLLAFITYWVLNRFPLDTSLKSLYAATIRDHWETERIEKNPLWNFIYAASGGSPFDLQEALWTLRRYPLDLVDWTVRNSDRSDLTWMPDNFRSQRSAELLPPGERPIQRWNGNPFLLDGGDEGRGELAGDEFLLPYWMARYLKIIE